MAANKTSSSGTMTAATADVRGIVLPSMPVTTTTFSAANGKQSAGGKTAGSSNDVVLFGSSGNDWMAGGNAADMLFGAEGDDILSGGKGADTLIGGAGNDFLYGGSGNDVFAYKSLDDGGLDVICDWNSGDLIDIRPLLLNGGVCAISYVDTDGDQVADASLVTVTANGIAYDIVVVTGCTSISAADLM